MLTSTWQPQPISNCAPGQIAIHDIYVIHGGNTLFANMYAAYDALGASTKEHIQGLTVVHDHDDIIMWDNRCTMHAVEPFDNATVQRIMHRVTLVDEGRPQAA